MESTDAGAGSIPASPPGATCHSAAGSTSLRGQIGPPKLFSFMLENNLGAGASLIGGAGDFDLAGCPAGKSLLSYTSGLA